MGIWLYIFYKFYKNLKGKVTVISIALISFGFAKEIFCIPYDLILSSDNTPTTAIFTSFDLMYQYEKNRLKIHSNAIFIFHAANVSQ